MKAVILAGGFGTRLSEETHMIPKPMVEIGDRPILWHIMKIYSHYGISEFVICCGYKGYVIKEWFANYFLHNSDVTVDLAENKLEIHNSKAESWRVTLVDTGLHTMTGGRIKRIQSYVGDETFLLTYGDGLIDADLNEITEFHRKSGRILTATAYRPGGKFGAIDIAEKGKVTAFTEKPVGESAWISAGFFVCEPEIFDYLPDSDETVFERAPIESIAAEGKMMAFQHYGFWKPMDTLRDRVELNEMWEQGNAPWKVWADELGRARR